jgi:hypothetical protein
VKPSGRKFGHQEYVLEGDVETSALSYLYLFFLATMSEEASSATCSHHKVLYCHRQIIGPNHHIMQKRET